MTENLASAQSLTERFVAEHLGATVRYNGQEWIISGVRGAAVIIENEDERIKALALADVRELLGFAR